MSNTKATSKAPRSDARLLPSMAWLAWLACVMASTPSFAETLNLVLGTSRTLEFEERVTSVHSSTSGVVSLDPKADKKAIKITGVGSGRTTVNIKLRKGLSKSLEVMVEAKHMSRHERLQLIASTLNRISGLSAHITKGKVRVTGVIASSEAASSFFGEIEKNRDLIIDATTKKYHNARLIADTINTVLTQNGINNLRVRAAGRLLAMQGMAKDDNEKQLAMKIAQMIDPSVEDQIEDLQYNAGPSVQVDVMFLEYADSDNLNVSLLAMTEDAQNTNGAKIGEWQSAPSARSIKGQGQSLWTVAPLKSMLSMIQTKTNSRVMANPKMVVRSGHEASFQSGGVQYFKTINVAEGAIVETLTEVPYGFNLDVRPKVDAIGQIDVLLKVEMSEFGDREINSLPNLVRSKTDTAVTLKNGYSVLLTGFKVKRDRKSVKRIPFFADIPIIGELFKARQMDGEERQIMILLTVHAVDADENQIDSFTRLSQHKKPGRSWQEFSSQSEDDIEFSIFD